MDFSYFPPNQLRRRQRKSHSPGFVCCTFIMMSMINSICFPGLLIAAENDESNPIANHPTKDRLSFAYSIDELKANHHADEMTAFQFMDNTHLLFSIPAKAKKLRGNLLLLADTNEVPLQRDLTGPLATQLSSLGWEVTAPAIARNDFIPQKLKEGSSDAEDSSAIESADGKEDAPNPTDNTKTTTANSSAATTNKQLLALAEKQTFFKSAKEYSDYYCQLINQVMAQPALTGKPLLVVTHGDAAYWVMSCLPQMANVKYLAMIAPTKPLAMSDSIENLFKQQTCPLFLFSPESDANSDYMKASQKRIWGGRNLRINRGSIGQHKLEIEDSTVARLITGWVETKNRRN